MNEKRIKLRARKMTTIIDLIMKDVYEGVKEWWRKRKINPMEVAVDRLRKEAKWENETYGANWHIPFDADD